jgi:molybdopterin/thiamine biosynthesis adenylyltransferase
MGVGKMIMLDKDVVDISNLNRQILFGFEDVGKPKVEVAREKILRDHLINKSA